MVIWRSEPAFYRLAGQTIHIDRGVPELQSFRMESQVFSSPEIPSNLSILAENPPALQVEGMLADRFSSVLVWQDDKGTLLDISGAGRFWIAGDGSCISLVSSPAGCDPALLRDALLGPALVLALALKGTWCLHASALVYEDMLIAFLGESGTGKSTLAAFLAFQPGVRRVADDILPVTLQNGGLSARPQFPQLKLPIDQQAGPGIPEKLPFSALYMLEEQPRISIQALGPGESALALARHTVAARLFDRQLLSLHFEFGVQAGSDIPLRRLAYPHIRSKLPLVWEALQADLEVHTG